MLQSIITRITQSIIDMDISALGEYLDDDKLYSNLSKSEFLSEMEMLFNTFKSEGDTKLIAESGACASAECNCGIKGYNFSGPSSQLYISVIFETEGDELIDVSLCHYFRKDSSDEILTDQIFAVSAEEGHSNFNEAEYSEEELLILEQKCDNAFREIVTGESVFLFSEDIWPWYKKHSELFEMIPFNINHSEPIENFVGLFGKFLCVLKCFLYPFCYDNANKEFLQIKRSGVRVVRMWMDSVQPVYERYACLAKYVDRQNFYQGFIEFSYEHKIRMSTADIHDIVEFILNYQEAELICSRDDLSLKPLAKVNSDTLF
jgi:hypothetical protein